MPASSGAVRGYGSTVRIGVGETPTWTAIVGIQDLEFPDQTPDSIDVTHLTSPGDTEEMVRDMKKAVSWPLTHHYVPGSAMDTALAAVEASGEDFILEIKANGADAVEYAAYLSSYRPTTIQPKGSVMQAISTFVVKAKVVA